MTTYFLVALGSALGGAARYWLSGLVAQRTAAPFPWGTLAVNITGSFAIGAFFSWAGSGDLLLAAPTWHQVTTYGFLGGYTTFSSFSLEVLHLIRDGDVNEAIRYVALSFALCIAAAAAGFFLIGLVSAHA